MAILPLVQGSDNPVLRKKSVLVKKIDRKIRKLIADMIETMIAANGIGLAAPQVGVNLRIYIARLNFDTPHEMNVPMINPEFVKASDEFVAHEEGCLSLPERFGTVRRAKEVAVRYMDQRGGFHTLHLEGLNARIIQHEMDHLDAMLIADKFEKEIVPDTPRSL